jgi:hypothetical protein
LLVEQVRVLDGDVARTDQPMRRERGGSAASTRPMRVRRSSIDAWHAAAGGAGEAPPVAERVNCSGSASSAAVSSSERSGSARRTRRPRRSASGTSSATSTCSASIVITRRARVASSSAPARAKTTRCTSAGPSTARACTRTPMSRSRVRTARAQAATRRDASGPGRGRTKRDERVGARDIGGEAGAGVPCAAPETFARRLAPCQCRPPPPSPHARAARLRGAFGPCAAPSRRSVRLAGPHRRFAWDAKAREKKPRERRPPKWNELRDQPTAEP